jgi:hypothetical protein
MAIPIILSRQGFIEAVIKVFVVGEYDMTPNVIQLGWSRERVVSIGPGATSGRGREGCVQILPESHR